jgi:hypothetical protein
MMTKFDLSTADKVVVGGLFTMLLAFFFFLGSHSNERQNRCNERRNLSYKEYTHHHEERICKPSQELNTFK